MTTDDLFIRRVYTHRGIRIAVDIDLVNKTISLVEPAGKDFKWKKWVFAERGAEYMNGWLLILEAMKKAIQEATKELDAAKAKSTKRMTDMLVALADANLDKVPSKKGIKK